MISRIKKIFGLAYFSVFPDQIKFGSIFLLEASNITKNKKKFKELISDLEPEGTYYVVFADKENQLRKEVDLNIIEYTECKSPSSRFLEDPQLDFQKG